MKICDRCGDRIKEDELQTVHFPYDCLNIRVYFSLNEWMDIDLCEHCKKEILNFALGERKPYEKI